MLLRLLARTPAPEPFEKAPPGDDDALRARVNKFYYAFMAGKFKEAYLLVADDSQDKFFELAKDQYKSCEIIKIRYTENFTKATVVTSCKSDWRWHGAVTLTTFPLTSTWALVDGQWYWHFVKPTMVPNPFSPTGYTPLPPDTETDNTKLVPSDIPGAGKSILSKVGIDKSSVQLLSNQQSEAVVHLRNDMPGEVSATLDQPNIPGLTVSLGQYRLDGARRQRPFYSNGVRTIPRSNAWTARKDERPPNGSGADRTDRPGVSD